MNPDVRPFDSHAHAWRRWPYRPRVPDPDTRGSGDALLHEMQRNNIASAVVVGAAIDANLRNNNYLLALQQRWPGKIFAFPDHDSYWTQSTGASPAHTLESLLAKYQFSGISLYLSDDEDGSRLLDRQRGAAFRIAASRHMILSLGMRPHHVPKVLALAGKHPQLRVLCHHLAGITSRRPASLHDQLDAVLPLHEAPNVFLKLSGFPYLAPEPWKFPFSEQADVVQAGYEVFGANRLCWGSNFPVIDGAITYRQSLEVIRSLLPNISDHDRDALLGGTMRSLLNA